MAENSNIATVDGVRAIELRYRAVKETDTDEVAFYQTSMRLNSPSLGVLTPDRFLSVLNCTDQCIPVFKLALVQAIQAAAKFEGRELDFKWISLYMPLRLLRKNDCADIVSEITGKFNTSADKICFEIPLNLLNDNGECAPSLAKLRKLGFHTMLNGVGGDKCPLMKLAAYDLDYIMLDPQVAEMLDVSEKSDSCVRSLISFVNELGAEPVATGVTSSGQTRKLYDFECSFYTGAYAGNYVQERYVRRKSAE